MSAESLLSSTLYADELSGDNLSSNSSLTSGTGSFSDRPNSNPNTLNLNLLTTVITSSSSMPVDIAIQTSPMLARSFESRTRNRSSNTDPQINDKESEHKEVYMVERDPDYIEMIVRHKHQRDDLLQRQQTEIEEFKVKKGLYLGPRLNSLLSPSLVNSLAAAVPNVVPSMVADRLPNDAAVRHLESQDATKDHQSSNSSVEEETRKTWSQVQKDSSITYDKAELGYSQGLNPGVALNFPVVQDGSVVKGTGPGELNLPMYFTDHPMMMNRQLLANSIPQSGSLPTEGNVPFLHPSFLLPQHQLFTVMNPAFQALIPRTQTQASDDKTVKKASQNDSNIVQAKREPQ